MWLVLENNISDNFIFNNKYTYLLPLSKINLIVGKNNSGKCYLMRQIIKSTIKILSREDIKNYVFNEDNFEKSENIEIFSTIDEFKEINDKYFSKKLQNYIDIIKSSFWIHFDFIFTI